MEIRPATPQDAAAMTAIYNEGIAERIATFETRPRVPEEVAAWLDGPLPVLVAVRDGEVAGFARALPYSDRPAYAGVVEDSVYVAGAHRGAGVGRALLDALADTVARAGAHKLVALIFTTNAPSIALHRRAGWRTVGVYRRHGRLEGDWRDVAVMERLVGDGAMGLPPDA